MHRGASRAARARRRGPRSGVPLRRARAGSLTPPRSPRACSRAGGRSPSRKLARRDRRLRRAARGACALARLQRRRRRRERRRARVDGLPTRGRRSPSDATSCKDGGTIRWAIDEFPRQWNLNHVDGPTVADGDGHRRACCRARSSPTSAANARTSTPTTSTSRKVIADRAAAGRHATSSTARRAGRTASRSPGATTRPSGRRCAAPTGKFQVADNTGYERIASVERGTRRLRGRRHVQASRSPSGSRSSTRSTRRPRTPTRRASTRAG